MHEQLYTVNSKNQESGECSMFQCTQLELHIQSKFNVMQDLVGRLTLDEMVAQMSHGGASNNGILIGIDSLIMMFRILFAGPAPAITRLGINPYQWGTECLSGDVNAGPATSFPQSIGMVSA